MGWHEIDIKFKNFKENKPVVYSEKIELEFLERHIRNSFPKLFDFDIDYALKRCSVDDDITNSSNNLVKCLMNQLGGEW